jgi:hypothetical protein
MESRADIHYAMSLSRWLALEGVRAVTVEQIAMDVVFIARKLGFDSVRMRLEDEEQVWRLNGTGTEKSKCFQHKLPGHKYCFLELCIALQNSKTLSTADDCNFSEAALNTFSIQAELVAEGWAKAMRDWQKRHQLPARFDARVKVSPTIGTDGSKTDLPGAEALPFTE